MGLEEKIDTYDCLIRCSIYEIEKDLQDGKISIDPDSMQKVYRYYFKNKSSKYIKKIIEITGVKPDNQIVQNTYRELIIDFRVNRLKKIIEATGIRPEKEVVWRGYKYLLKDELGIMNKIREIKDITGVTPKNEDIQSMYRKYIKELNNKKIKRLEEITGVSIDWKWTKEQAYEVYETYLTLLESKNTSVRKEILSWMERIIENTNIKPPKKLIHDVYIKYLIDMKPYLIDEVNKILNEEIYITEDDAQLIYESYFNKMLEANKRDIEKIKNKIIEIRNITGVTPKDEYVQEIFLKGLLNEKFKVVEKLKEATEIPISNYVANKVYKHFLNTGDVSRILKVRNLSGVEIPEEVKEFVYKKVNAPAGI